MRKLSVTLGNSCDAGNITSMIHEIPNLLSHLRVINLSAACALLFNIDARKVHPGNPCKPYMYDCLVKSDRYIAPRFRSCRCGGHNTKLSSPYVYLVLKIVSLLC